MSRRTFISRPTLTVIRWHRHVWIGNRAEIVFDGTARLIGIRHVWVFDPVYSAYLTMGLAAFNFYTAVKVDGVEGDLGSPNDYQATIAGDRLMLRFLLPLKTPTKPKEMALRVGDPAFFVAFTVPEGPDAVTLDGAPESCQVSVKQPEDGGHGGIQRLADDITAALKGQLAASPRNTPDFSNTPDFNAPDFSGQVFVSCQ